MDIDIKEIFRVMLENVKEFSRLNQSMERVVGALDEVEKNEIDLIGRNKGLYSQIESLSETIKDQKDRAEAHAHDICERIDRLAAIPAEKVDALAIAAIVAKASEKAVKDYVDEQLIAEKEKWTKRLMFLVVFLVLTIGTLIGLDWAGIIDLAGKTALG
jgi:transcriptional regulatory protein LevR